MTDKEKLDKAITELDNLYNDWCEGLGDETCCVDYCSKYHSCVECFYKRTVEILRGVKND